MRFKTRMLSRKRGVLCLVKGSFMAETIDDAIAILKELDERFKTPIRAYEISTKKRIVGGNLEFTK